jgi:hypothetical protein
MTFDWEQFMKDGSGAADAARKADEPGVNLVSSPLTNESKRIFLEHLARYGNVSWAAERIGKSRACLYEHRQKDTLFAAAWRRASERIPNGHSRLSAETRCKFLTSLAQHGNVSRAALRAGKSRASFYNHRRKNPAFAHAWDRAQHKAFEADECRAVSVCSSCV